MTLATFAKKQGLTYEGFLSLENQINRSARELYEYAATLHPTDTGIYHPISEIIKSSDGNLTPYTIMALKALGMEFYDNCSLWRI